MDPDAAAYRRNVRNMLLVLAAILITIFAAIFTSPYLTPSHEAFQSSVSLDSPFGFSLHLQVNSTSLHPNDRVLLSGWLNSTSGSLDNISSARSWSVGPGNMWTRVCTSGWPLGLGVMYGHYTQDNYTLGSLIPLPQPLASCPVQKATPAYFLLESLSSRALVDIGGTPQYWTLQSNYVFGYSPGEGLHGAIQGQLPSGVYTVVLADEWGDVLTTNFSVS